MSSPRLLAPRQVVALSFLAVVTALAASPAGAGAATTAKATKGTLTVKGDSSANFITLSTRSTATDTVFVDVNDDGIAEFMVKRDKFTQIAVNAGGGDDRVRIDNSGGIFTDTEQTTLNGEAGADTLIGGFGPETLSGGDGNDTVQPSRGSDVALLGAGNDAAVWNPGDGSDTIEGQGDSDRLQFNGANIAESFVLSANGSRLRFTRDVASIVMDTASVETIDIAALGGADTVTVGDLTGTGVTRVAPDLASFGLSDGAADTVIAEGTAGADVIGVSRTLASPDPIASGLSAVVTAVHADPTMDRMVVRGNGGADQVVAAEGNGALAAVTLEGGEGADVLSGTSGNDAVSGGPGNDTLLGKAGADALLGDGDADTITGGDGDDVAVSGGEGDDVFVWNPGDDTDVNEGDGGSDRTVVNGGNGDEVFTVVPNGTRVRFDRTAPAPFSLDMGTVEKLDVVANGGADTVSAANGLATLLSLSVDGGLGADTITGGDGADVLSGGADNDTVTPGRGNDTALLGAGDDTAVWNPGDASDTIEGQADADTLQFNGANIAEKIALSANGSRLRLTRDIAAIVMDTDDVEKVGIAALGGADTITVGDLAGTDVTAVTPDLGVGDAAADQVVVEGSGANDVVDIGRTLASADPVVTGLAGVVTMARPEAGLDRLVVRGNDGADQLVVNETVGALAGLLTLEGGLGQDVLSAGSGADTLSGGAGNDTLLGKGGADALNGDGDADTLTGGDGSDVASGGEGDDVLVWNPGDDTDVNEGDGGTDRTVVNGGNGDEHFTVVPNGTRVRFDRVNPAPFSLDMGTVEKLDVIANGGADTVTAANGLATLVALNVEGGLGNDTITGGDGADVLAGGDGNDTVTPGRGNDLALLGAGDDAAVWNPGDASDTIEGQADQDTLRFNGANIGEKFALSANGSRLRLTRDIGAVTMDADDVEAVALAALGGADSIAIGDLSATDVTSVTPDLGSAGVGDGSSDAISVSATNGDDLIDVSGSAGSVGVSGLATSVQIVRAESFDSLTVETLLGADTVDQSGLAAGTIQLTVN